MTGEEEEPLVEPTSASVMEVEVTPPNAAARPSDRPITNDTNTSGDIPSVDNISAPTPNPSTYHNHRPHLQLRFPPRTHVDIDSSRGQIRINASRSVGTTMGQILGNNSNTANGTHNILRMLPTRPMLPPLKPTPMPNQTIAENDANSTGNNNEDDGKTKFMADVRKYECVICFEYMDNPVGCGSCQTRFCKECLQRVLRQSAISNGSQSTDPPNSAKCPHCRSFFTLQSITLDNELRKEICDCTETVTCPFRGCGAELRIGLLKAHEATCPYMRMRCRFADWGCDWVGQRKFIEDHDAHQCEFRGGLGKLVERYRQCDAHTGHVLHHHHMQIGATSQMLALHSRQMMLLRNRNAGNVVDVFQLAYEASLFPGRFCAMREVWISLIGQHDAQCLVCNIMLLTPSLILILKEGLNGFALLSTVEVEKLSVDDLLSVADNLILSLMIGMLGTMCLSCFFIDSKSSHEWVTYNVRNIVLGPIMRDIAAVCMAMSHFCAMTFYSRRAGCIMWKSTAIVTIFYTSFVSCIMAKSNSWPSTASAMRSARAWPVVIFGLRYGFLVAMCGVAPSINAVVTMRLLKHPTLLSPKVNDSECFIQQLSTRLLIIISGLATSFEYATDMDTTSWRTIVLDWMLATTALVFANVSVFVLDNVGRRLGEKNFQTGNRMFMQARQGSSAILPNTKPTSIGCSIFGICSFLLLFLATCSR